MTKLRTLIITTALLIGLPATAHHAFTSIYHMDQTISVEGVVTRFLFANPHARIYLDVTDDAGEIQKYMAEGGTPNVLVRQGWNSETIQTGQQVKIDGNPGKIDPLLIHWVTVTMPDGEVLFGEDLDFNSVDRNRRRRE